MSEHKEPIPSMIYNASVGGHVTNSQQIIDENENKEQSQINAEVKRALGEEGSVDERINKAKTDIIGEASSDGNTLKKIEDRVSPLESAVGTGGSVDSRISAAVATETTRAQGAEEQLRTLYNNLQQSQPIPVTSLPATGETGKIYRLAGTNSYADYMYAEGALTTPIKMAEYDNAIDDEPTAGSDNLVKSGGVAKEFSSREGLGSSDFSIADENDNDIVQFSEGHIKTKNFNSKELIKDSDLDFRISDENDNCIVLFRNGHIKTKNFDSSKNASSDNSGLMSAEDKIKLDLVSAENLPVYYTEYMENKIAQINKIEFEAGFEADSFIFCTDTHTKNNNMMAPLLSAHLYKNTNCFKSIYGGDAIWAYSNAGSSVEDCKNDIINQWRKQQNNWLKTLPNGEFYNVRGNHDFTIRIAGTDHSTKLDCGYTFSQDVDFNNIVCRNLSNPKVVFNENDNGCYYYFDEPQSKLRYLILDGQSKDFSATTGNYAWGNDMGMGISDSQLSWVKENALLTMPSGYSLICVMHEGITSVTYPGGYDVYLSLKSELESLANKIGDYASINVNKVIFVSGHWHTDDSVFENNILHIGTANDYLGADVNLSMYYDSISRAIGTITEQLFDYIIVDIAKKKVRCIRIGAGYNRYFNLDKITLNVGSTTNIVSELTPISYYSYNTLGNTWSNNSWNIANDVVSVNNSGTITTLKTGEAVVFAKDANNNKEYYYINVI